MKLRELSLLTNPTQKKKNKKEKKKSSCSEKSTILRPMVTKLTLATGQTSGFRLPM